MSTVHLTLQGKGGVGKSVVATLLAQYLRDRGIAAKCFDADPLNQTLAGFAGLGVTKVDLMETTKDPLLALWVAQPEFLEETAAEHQKLLSEFEAALGRNQIAWSDRARNFAQLSLNGALRAARDNTALLLEEAARTNAGVCGCVKAAASKRTAAQNTVVRFSRPPWKGIIEFWAG